MKIAGYCIGLAMMIYCFSGCGGQIDQKQEMLDGGIADQIKAQPVVKQCGEEELQKIKQHAGLPEEYKTVSIKPSGDFCEVIIALEDQFYTFYTAYDFVLAGDIYKNMVPQSRKVIEDYYSQEISRIRAPLETFVSLTYTREIKA